MAIKVSCTACWDISVHVNVLKFCKNVWQMAYANIAAPDQTAPKGYRAEVWQESCTDWQSLIHSVVASSTWGVRLLKNQKVESLTPGLLYICSSNLSALDLF